MATINPTSTGLDTYRSIVDWSGVAAGDTCAPIEISAATWRSVSWAGTLAGFGATAAFEESNDGTNWSGLLGTAWPSGPRCQLIEGRARYVRPNISNLGVGDNLTFYLMFSQQPSI